MNFSVHHQLNITIWHHKHLWRLSRCVEDDFQFSLLPVITLKASPANCSLTANNTGNSNKSKKKGEVLGWMANTTAYNPTFPIGHFKLQWHVTSPPNLGQKTTQKTNLPENSSWFGKWQKPHCRRGGEPHKWRLNCWSISLETYQEGETSKTSLKYSLF